MDLILDWHHGKQLLTLSADEAEGALEYQRIMNALEEVDEMRRQATTKNINNVIEWARKKREDAHNHQLASGAGIGQLVTPSRMAPMIYNFNSRNIEALIEHVRMAVYNARLGNSKLNKHEHRDYILTLEGMSSNLTRHLMNNMNSALGANYLEIGVWRGSTAVAALSGNEANMNSAVMMDVWSSDADWFFGDQQESYEIFNKSLHQCINIQKLAITIIREDCFSENAVDYTNELVQILRKFNVVRLSDSLFFVLRLSSIFYLLSSIVTCI